jgi:hypothetical protein
MPSSGLGYQIAQLAVDVRSLKDQLSTSVASPLNGAQRPRKMPSRREARLRGCRVEPGSEDDPPLRCRRGPRPPEVNDFHVSTTNQVRVSFNSCPVANFPGLLVEARCYPFKTE